ncbi:MAG: hypothetical protein ACRDRW_04215 [Pseudonocardiaceae bacterium]
MIRAVLAEHAPEDCARFEAEFAPRLPAQPTISTCPLSKRCWRWHMLATMVANPLTPEEPAQLQRAKAGDFTGLSTGDESGNWVRL